MKSGDLAREGEPPHPSGTIVDPFVGRTREFDRVCHAGEALRLGRGRLVVVSGEAGVGKSRFCAEVAERSREAGAQVVEARCWLDGGAPPLWPWQSILGDLCGNGRELLTAGADLDDVGPDRFARFVAVTDCLAQACADKPLVLVIDDIQGADCGTLLLTRFVARSLTRFPLLLVLGHRSGEPPAGTEEARLLDEIEREATPIVLGGFDRSEAEAFLAEHGIDTTNPGLVTTLFGLTRGHPLHLRRVVQTMLATGTAPARQGGMRVAIQQAFDTLDDEQRRLLAYAAVLGPEPDVAETADVAGSDTLAVMAAAQAGVTAGLVSAVHDDGRFPFSHELVRAAVEDSLGTAERLEVHARAAELIVSHGGVPHRRHSRARAAHHARCAAPRSRQDAERAVSLCESAAQAMVRHYAYEKADELFTAAVELHDTARLGKPDPLLVLQWADATALRGHHRVARERYEVAITRSQAEGKPALLVESVLGWAGVWLDDYATPAEKARMLGLYRLALDGLPRDDPLFEVPRDRLRVRLAAESTYLGGPVEELYDAVGKTRATGDRRALAEALALAQHALFTQEHTHARQELNDELLAITAETDLGNLGLVGLLWRVVNMLHLGDPQFIRILEVLRERATTLGNDHSLYNVAVIDVLVAIGLGRLDDAEAQAGRCYEAGQEIGRGDAFAYFATHVAVIRWLQGRDAEMLGAVGDLMTSPRIADTEFSVWAMGACLAARAGQHDHARSILRTCVPGSLTDLVPSGTWMAGMVALVEAAYALGDRDLAAQAYELLEPHADVPAAVGLGIAVLGSVERPLGLAAGVLGRHDEAVAHLERAIQRTVNRPVLAMCRADLATALVRRPGSDPEDRHRAEQLLRSAIEDGISFGMTGRVTAWEAELAALVEPGRDPRSTSGVPDVGSRAPERGAERGTSGQEEPAADPEGVIRLDGKRWVMGVDGRRIRVPNLVGMRYMAELLANPNKRIPAVALTGQLPDVTPSHRQEVIDAQARSEYAARARELAADLAEAEAANDLHRAEHIRTQIDLLVDQLETTTGLGGAPRHFPTDHERARVAVQKAIKRALDAVEDADPTLAEMLRTTITTGVTCTYTPNAKTPATWRTRDARPDSEPPRTEHA